MPTGTLEVVLLKAKGLTNSDFLGHMDPHILIQYEGQERKSSVARGQGENPVWNEKLRLRVEYPGSGEEFKLIFKIFDKDTFTSYDFDGQAMIYIEDLLALGVENGTAELQLRKYSVIQSDGTYCREIKVGSTFAREEEEEEYDGEEFGG